MGVAPGGHGCQQQPSPVVLGRLRILGVLVAARRQYRPPAGVTSRYRPPPSKCLPGCVRLRSFTSDSLSIARSPAPSASAWGHILPRGFRNQALVRLPRATVVAAGPGQQLRLRLGLSRVVDQGFADLIGCSSLVPCTADELFRGSSGHRARAAREPQSAHTDAGGGCECSDARAARSLRLSVRTRGGASPYLSIHSALITHRWECLRAQGFH